MPGHVLALCAALAGTPDAAAATAAGTPGAGIDRANAAQAAHERGVALRRTDPGASLAAFRESAALWESVRESGAENGPLEFNLGNAWLEAGDAGRAIAAYLRAERLMPGDPDLGLNLAQARTMVSGPSGSGRTMLVDSVARWWHLVPRSARLGLGWACWIGFWLAVAAWAVRPTGRAGRMPWRSAMAVLGTGAIVFGGSVLADEAIHRMRPRAVVVDASVVLRKGNGDGYEPAVVEALGPGVECTVLEERPGWTRIALPDGRTGWVRSGQLERA